MDFQTPLAPGGLITITGNHLTKDGNDYPPSTGQWATMLGETSVVLSGRLLPLKSASNGQINAIVPFDLAVNTRHRLQVARGNQVAVGVDLSISSTQPGILTRNTTDSSRGQVFIVGPDGQTILADAANPAGEGDTLLIRCAGLGTVNRSVVAGVPAPVDASVDSTKVVSVKIGAQNAEVLSAGLVAGEIGVYQVRVAVPSGISAASNVPVILGADGLSSPPVMIAIK